MSNLDIIIDPLIGTIIGFGTNYIAVKMLFRPYKPIKIGKWQLPFTPGVIPKRREKLAEALGNAISTELFTNNDIKNIFLSPNVKELVVSSIEKEIFYNDNSIKEILVQNISEENYNSIKEKLENIIAKKITDGLLSMNLGDIIVKEGVSSVKDKIQNSFFGKFISDDLIMSIVLPAGEKVEQYIELEGEGKIIPYIDKELDELAENNMSEIIAKTSITEERLKDIIEKIYIKIIEDKMNNIFESFDISEVVVNKINQMDVKDIEKLFMNVMKKELNAIVNLGAVLGFFLGVMNIFI